MQNVSPSPFAKCYCFVWFLYRFICYIWLEFVIHLWSWIRWPVCHNGMWLVFFFSLKIHLLSQYKKESERIVELIQLSMVSMAIIWFQCHTLFISSCLLIILLNWMPINLVPPQWAQESKLFELLLDARDHFHRYYNALCRTRGRAHTHVHTIRLYTNEIERKHSLSLCWRWLSLHA